MSIGGKQLSKLNQGFKGKRGKVKYDIYILMFGWPSSNDPMIIAKLDSGTING